MEIVTHKALQKISLDKASNIEITSKIAQTMKPVPENSSAFLSSNEQILTDDQASYFSKLSLSHDNVLNSLRKKNFILRKIIQ